MYQRASDFAAVPAWLISLPQPAELNTQRTSTPSAESTARKNTIVTPTMMNTSMVVSHVSRQLGHVTLLPSRRTSRKNASAPPRVRAGAGNSLPALSAVAVFFVSAITSFVRRLAGVEGLEPTAYGFGDRRSTN